MKYHYRICNKSAFSVFGKRSGRKRTITVPLLLFLLFLICGESHASQMHSSATLLWDTLSISYDPGVNISYTSKESLSWAFVQDSTALDGNYQLIDFFGDTSALATVPDATSNAFTSSTALAVDAQIWDVGANAHGGALRGAEFIVSGIGNIYISIGYDVDQYLSAGTGAFAEGLVGAFLGLWNETSDLSDRDEDILINQVANGMSLTNSSSGMFSVSLHFNDGDSGSFQAIVDAHSQIVPEPNSLILIMCGLVCFVGLQRTGNKPTDRL